MFLPIPRLTQANDKARQKAIAQSNSETEVYQLPPPQAGPQTDFYNTKASVCIYGGSAGAGKSFALLLKAAKHINVSDYGSVIFRRTSPEIKNEGGLWDESCKLYRSIPGSKSRENDLDWIFPSSAISFGHIQYEKDAENKFPGAQIAHIGFDELTKFTERQFWFLFSRNRTTCGVEPRIDATCNPDADSWVAKLVEWYIDQKTGYPIPERSGVIRYFYRINAEMHWGDTAEELEQKYPDMAAIAPPKSFTFIAANVYDNPALLNTNPQYLQNLMAQHPVEMERLLKGNWKVKYEAGKIFNRNWFEIVNAIPEKRGVTVRFWDFAATAKEFATKTSFYSANIKMTLIDGIYYIADCDWEQVSGDDGDDSVKGRAQSDGRLCKVRWELEGGSASRRYEAHLKRELSGFDAAGVLPLGDKVTRALPWATAAKNGKIKLLRAAWNDQFLSAVNQFDGTAKPLVNDIVDSGSGAYAVLGESGVTMAIAPGGKINNPFKIQQ
jgi:phage terminase large subunit-like protein